MNTATQPAQVAHPIYQETDLEQIRGYFRRGEWTRPTRSIALGYAQAGLVVIPKQAAYDFLLFCQRNPKPCPLLDVTDPGDAVPRIVAPSADLRTDLPKYRVFRRGELIEEVTDVRSYWRDDLVGFVLGCSISFDAALAANNIPNRRVEQRGAAAPSNIFWTNIDCRPAGQFAGPMAVGMRPMLPAQAIRAVQVTSRFPLTHGAPVHIGDPAALGIADLAKPDIGAPVTIGPGEIPVFWACVATVWEAVLRAKLEITITHAPGCMFITDVRDETLAVL